MNSFGKIIFIYIIFIQLISDCLSVRILRHWISQSIDSSNFTNSIIMDCDYQYDPDEDIKLVVRWFYNDWPEPIYQWIPESDNKRYIGESIRKYFDMNFQIGDDRFTKYRAIRLMPPSPTSLSNSTSKLPFDLELSGNYTCVISSIMSQDSRQGQLIFYVPPSKFEFNIFSYDGQLNLPSNDFGSTNDLQNNDDNDNDNYDGPMVRCTAHDVYPKPLLSFSELIANSDTMKINNNNNINNGQPYTQLKQSFPKINVHTMINDSNNNNNNHQLYTSWFEYRLKIDSIKVGTIFECRLEIPTTSYIRKKRIKLIYPSTYLNGIPSRTAAATTNNKFNNFNVDNNRWLRQYPNINNGNIKQLTDYQAQLHNNKNQKNMATTTIIVLNNHLLIILIQILMIII